MARRLKPLLERWSSRVFSVELDEAPLYFGIREKSRGGGTAPRAFARLREDRCFSVLVCGGDAVRREKFYAGLRAKLSGELPAGAALANMFSFLPEVKDSLVKGYFLRGSSGNSARIERLLRDYEQRDPVVVCSYFGGEDGEEWTQRLWPRGDEEFYVVPSDPPTSHPSVLNMINTDVFHDFNEAREVLKKVQDALWNRFI